MGMTEIKNAIINGNTALGIEFGSTRIKAVLVGEDNTPIAAGNHEWENRYENNIWTYSRKRSGMGCRTATGRWQKTYRTNTALL